MGFDTAALRGTCPAPQGSSDMRSNQAQRLLGINPTLLRSYVEGIATRYASLGLTAEWAWLGCRLGLVPTLSVSSLNRTLIQTLGLLGSPRKTLQLEITDSYTLSVS